MARLDVLCPTRPRRPVRVGALLAALVVGLAGGGVAGEPEAPAPASPRYADGGRLVRPDDYREWVFLTSGLGMTYGPAGAGEGGPPRFDNVFVNREAYRAFLQTGTWPDRTVLILEVRRSEVNASINKGGHTQGERVALEAAVKDRPHFPGNGWAYFSFDGPEGPLDAAPPLPPESSCYSCHKDHGAVDNTFVQFYPTLQEVAPRHGTLRPAGEPAKAP